jgi:hypothetical protein
MKSTHSLYLFLSVLIAVALVSCAPAAAAPSQPVTTPDLTHATVNASFGVPGDGNVLPLGLLDTVRYMLQVFRGDPGTFVMQSANGDYLLAWSMQGNTWGFMAVSGSGKPLTDLASLVPGQYANTTSFCDLVKGLEQNGWEYVGPAALPAWITTAMGTASAFALKYGDMLASPLPMIIIMPGAGFVDPNPVVGQD